MSSFQEPCQRSSLSHCFVALLFLAITSTSFGKDKKHESWVSFRNGHENLGIAASALPEDLELLWEFATPDGTSSTPVIADGKAYAGTLSGDIHCFDLKTGKKEWTYKSKENVAANDIAPGFNAALALNDDTVFGGDDFGGFHAVNRKTGKRQWFFETDGEIVGGAQIVGDKVIFGSHDGYLYCFDAKDGEQVWKAETHGPVNATPTIAGKHTFTTGCDQPVLRVFEIEGGTTAKEVPLNSLLLASAALKNNTLYFGTDGGTVFALDWKDSKQEWDFSIPKRDQQMNSSPAATDEFIIIGSRDKHVHCIDRKSGELKWSFATRGRVDSSPVIAGDRVYFGSSDKNLYGLNIKDGKEVWKFPAKQSIAGSAAIADGYLVIGTESSNGRILCFGKK
ncbi:PQQ-binding-like beta-propeller repeat protein [Planctomicrobium sp.]|nr:PQQ-binding-like beta-propeller repeat protein [Planctomicrobium sp.]